MEITKDDFEDYRDEMIDGSAKGAYGMAFCYINGEGVDQNYELGLEYLEASAGLGYVTAIFHMFQFYDGQTVSGMSIAENYNKKMEYAKLLAFANHLYNVESEEQKYVYIGKMELSLIYINDNLNQDNQKKGFKFMKDLADAGFPDAQYYLAVCYVKGIGTIQDYSAARKYANSCIRNNGNDVHGNVNTMKYQAERLYEQLIHI